MQVTTELVTPKMAEAYLEKNTRNRPLSSQRVLQLAREMAKGTWRKNGDTIRFSSNGVLLDGQHRLSAILKSGASQEMVVVRGLEDEAFTTIDTGAKRSASDVLSIAGFKNAKSVASAARLFILWKRHGKPIYGPNGGKISNEEILLFCEANSLPSRAASYVIGNAFWRKFASNSVAGFVYMAIACSDEQLAVDFMDEVSGRTAMNPDSPAFLLREKLLEMSGTKLSWKKETKIALCLKAFRHWNSGRKVKLLKVTEFGAKAEKTMFTTGLEHDQT